MDIIPSTIIELDRQLRRIEGTEHPLVQSALDRSRFLESTWDDVLASCPRELGSALAAAGLLRPGHHLRLFARQESQIDLVFIECEPGGRAARFVLVEDKLVRNPQARREVLAQLLDYASQVEDLWSTPEAVRALVHGRAPGELTDDDAHTLAHSAARGDMLLVIASDTIDGNLLRLAQRVAVQHHPLRQTQLALVSLSLYDLGDRYLFVPHVVSAVERHTRPLGIEVRVVDAAGKPVAAKVTPVSLAAEPPSAAKQDPAATAFLQRVQARLAPVLLERWPLLELTKTPRKTFDAWFESPGQWTKFHVRFGHAPDQWAPLWVEVVTTFERAGMSRRLHERMVELKAQERLDESWVVDAPTVRTASMGRSFSWQTPPDLDDQLLADVERTLLTLLEKFAAEVERLGREN